MMDDLPAAVVPTPRCPVSVRVATASDLPFLDTLQGMHRHMVGWFPKQQMETYVNGGHVLVAEHDAQPRMQLGYCIAKDHYSGRDDCGIVYQLNVMPVRQRHLIGATLIKATFERAAYGCRLFACWCAQDLQANYFWEALGFMPLAYRAGSRGKQRLHVFWQRRVRENDVTTPWWYPAETKSGAIREDRLVFPILPEVSWRDVRPIALSTLSGVEGPGTGPGGALTPLALPGRSAPSRARVSTAHRIAVVRSQSKHLQGLPPGKAAVITSGGLRYVDRGDYVPEPKPKRAPKAPGPKNDPKFAAAARELRDRYLEQINRGAIVPQSQGKYEVSRQLQAAPAQVKQALLLDAA
jgi:GNAT superfamily N-acetyltransferase